MKRLSTKIAYLVSSHEYCNHSLGAASTLHTRCRFCTETAKGRFTCVLHNDILTVEKGFLICKTPACARASQLSTTHIAEAPRISTSDIMKQALTEYRKEYNQLIKEGWSASSADKVATKYVLKECLL